MARKKRVGGWRWTRRGLLCLWAVLTLTVGLMLLNYAMADWSVPVLPEESAGPAAPEAAPKRLRVMSYNVRWGGAWKREFGRHPDWPSGTQANLDAIAELIVREKCDLVSLQEVCLQFSLNSPNQVAYLAEKTGLTHWAFANRFQAGLPFFRIRQGVAVLSHYPIIEVSSPPLLGTPPGWLGLIFRNHYVRVVLDLGGGERLVFYSLHMAANRDEVNLAETKQLVERVNGEIDPFILAGDFNAFPDSPSIAEVRSINPIVMPPTPPLGRTYCAWKPADWTGSRIIDYIFASGPMVHADYDTREVGFSDHLPLITEVELAPGR